MNNRSALINLILFILLLGGTLASGSMQCAVDCLAEQMAPRSGAIRVDDCHFVLSQQQTLDACANKACHQSVTPLGGTLGAPQVTTLQPLLAPLANGPQQPTPPLRATGSDPAPPTPRVARLPARAPLIQTLSQQRRSLRSTVLLI